MCIRDSIWGFSPVWVSWWDFSWRGQANPFPQSMHTWGFSPVWVSWWVFRLCAEVYPFPQSVHTWGFSPVWVSWWTFKLYSWVNPFPQSVHTWGFSPVWVIQCLFRSLGQLKRFPQSMQTWHRPSVAEDSCEVVLVADVWGVAVSQLSSIWKNDNRHGHAQDQIMIAKASPLVPLKYQDLSTALYTFSIQFQYENSEFQNNRERDEREGLDLGPLGKSFSWSSSVEALSGLCAT